MSNDPYKVVMIAMGKMLMMDEQLETVRVVLDERGVALCFNHLTLVLSRDGTYRVEGK